MVANPRKLLGNVAVHCNGHNPILIPMPKVYKALIVWEWIFQIQRIKFPGSLSNYKITMKGLEFSLLCNLFQLQGVKLKY